MKPLFLAASLLCCASFSVLSSPAQVEGGAAPALAGVSPTQQLDKVQTSPLLRPVSDYTPRRNRYQESCPSLWCAPGLEVSIIDGQGDELIPGSKSGYTHLRVDRKPSALKLKNNRPHRVMFLFSVNRKNPLDGKNAVQASKGYVVPANSELVVDKTLLPDGAWFGSSWKQEGHIHINVHNETAHRPMDGGLPPHAPADAREYITDEAGRRFWVPPKGFVFRYASRTLRPSESLYMTYDIKIDASDDKVAAKVKPPEDLLPGDASAQKNQGGTSALSVPVNQK